MGREPTLEKISEQYGVDFGDYDSQMLLSEYLEVASIPSLAELVRKVFSVEQPQ